MGDDPATDGAAQRTAEQDQQLAHDADSSQSRDAVIQVQDVRVSFGSNEVLKGVSFQVRRGETLCILGGSGGGKSTLLKVMIGVLTPDSGHALIEGEHICCAPPKARARIRRKFGVTFQGSALLNSLTVAENVALPLEYHTTLPMDMIETVVKIKLHQVDLLQAADKLPSQLSGGMKKRAAVARALALDPRILFYDEPSAGLDPISTTKLDLLITRLKQTVGVTNVVVTHELESVRRIADHVVMLHEGRVILDGSLEELERSDDPRVKQFREGLVEGPEVSVDDEEQFLQDLLL